MLLRRPITISRVSHRFAFYLVLMPVLGRLPHAIAIASTKHCSSGLPSFSYVLKSWSKEERETIVSFFGEALQGVISRLQLVDASWNKVAPDGQLPSWLSLFCATNRADCRHTLQQSIIDYTSEPHCCRVPYNQPILHLQHIPHCPITCCHHARNEVVPSAAEADPEASTATFELCSLLKDHV